MMWFKVWLETPDAFFDWLGEARKAFAGFSETIRQERFGGRVSAAWRTFNTYWKSNRSISERMSRR